VEWKTEWSGPKIRWSRVEHGAGLAENDGAGAEREVAEREWNREPAESAAHSPLQPNISLH